MSAKSRDVAGQPARVSKTAVLVVTTLSSSMVPFTSASMNVAIPSLGAELGMDAVLMTWVNTAYLLTTAILLLPFGRLADMHGRKKMILYGTLLFTVASLLCALTPSASALLAFRIVQGIGSAMLFSSSVALLTSVYPASERGRALGINVAATYLSMSIGPFVGGLLTDHLGWRSIFAFMVPLGVIGVASILWGLPGEWAEARGEKLDVPGTAAYGLALAAVIYGLSRLSEPLGAGLLVAGLLAFAVFVRWESKVKNPVLNVALFRGNLVFAFSSLAALINYSATFANGFLLSLYLQYIKGLSPENAGLVLVSQPIMQAIVSPFAGRISDRWEPRIVASLGMAVTAGGLFLFSTLDAGTSLWLIVPTLLVFGVGFALFSAPNMNAIMGSVERRHFGVASAILSTMRTTGQMLSMGLATLIFALTIGDEQITPERHPVFLGGVHTLFLIFTGLSVAGIFASLFRGKLRVERGVEHGL